LNPAPSARQLALSGQVQGVGFRPFIYRLALEHQLTGWVRNCVGIVEIHVQGLPENLENFFSDIYSKTPPLAEPRLESDKRVTVGEYETFSILQSQNQGKTHINVPADLFLCDDCLAELNDLSNRRYHYPFINCTQCGPRYTLILNLPYDRSNTAMANFELCQSCLAEYSDPGNRRFHAEPIACPECGPSLSFYSQQDNDKNAANENEAAIKNTITALQQGKVVAVKGIGGYHLMCDANNTEAITKLRNNKTRPHKPLAVMFPAPLDNPFKHTASSVFLTDIDKEFLLQPARPILLVAKNKTTELPDQIAPGLNEIGIMLPYSPLHHLLLNKFDGPLVATSANISGEPVLIKNLDVEKRLGHIADAFLHHNRPIERPADDPVYRTIAGKPRPIRSGRGSTPAELALPFVLEEPVLAIGAHMKNTIALAWENRVVISPHIGEMNSTRSIEVFEKTINDFQKLYNVNAAAIVCDAHPGYTTTRWANKQGLPVYNIYHHHAHASAAFFECQTDETVLVFSWDGVGYGEDGTLWGGETFLGKPGEWKRVASMRPFNLPGGDKAGREPWRSAAALCWETGLPYEAIPEKDPLLKQAWQRKINTSQSTSVGRLFDAAAALTGSRTMASFEGQGPMEFEALCEQSDDHIVLELEKTEGLLVTDWEPLAHTMLNNDLTIGVRAALFHASLAHVILQQARAIRAEQGVNIVSFSGGVFQNRILTEHAITLLSEDGFNINFPELIPVNDASISFGQIIEFGFNQ